MIFKLMKLKYILIIFCLICTFDATQAQVLDEAEIRTELEKRGIDEDEVRKRLIDRGFDPENVDPNDPTQLIELKKATDEILAEMEREQKSRAASIEVKPKTQEKGDEALPQEDVLTAVDTSSTAPDVSPPNKNSARIYGQQLYRQNSIRFYKKSEYINTPSDYILGPGDVVTVSIWGRSEANFSQKISDGGYVKFYEVPRISLSGLKLKDARALVKAKLSRQYNFRNEEFELKVIATRNINVFITGEVMNVGSYNMSAVNTAVNALAASGGPSDIGSVRNIQLISSETGTKTLDLYQFLKNPLSSRDFYLNEGDYIVVPVAGKVVDIKGAINRPYKYELLSNETLLDLIDFAGGLKVNALRKNVKVTRYEDDKRVILNVDLRSLNDQSKFELRNGDVVEINSIAEELRNAVSVTGAVENGGQFAVSNNMRISDLMERTILSEDAILDIAYLSRLNDNGATISWELINIEEILNNTSSPKNIVLKNGDKLTIRGKSDFYKSNNIEVKGAVNTVGTFQLDNADELKISDAIFLANGLTPDATDFAYIIRNLPGSLSPEYIPVSVVDIVANPASDANISLKPGDILQVYAKNEYVDDTYITIDGAVRSPSKLKYDESLTLKDALLLSKGLTIDAATNKIDIYRLEFKNNNKTRTLVANTAVDENFNVVSGSDFKLQPFDHIIVRKAPEFEKQREVFISGEVKYPGKYYLLKDNFTVVDLIKGAGGVTNEAFLGGMSLKRTQNDIGYIIVDLEDAMNNPNSTTNMILQLQDSVYIPKINNLVSIQGAVNKSEAFNANISSESRINFVYEKNKNAKYYIEKSGGFQPKADKSSVTVKYPNGEMHKTKKFLFFNKYPKVVPGSTISVNYKEEEERGPDGEKEEIDWGKVLSNSIAQATTILSLILLIQNVN